MSVMRLGDEEGIGSVLERAADHHGPVPLWLDKPLDVDPLGGTSLDFGRLADLAGRLSGSLQAIGVDRHSTVVILKQPNLDTLVLASAAARLGALPVLISPTVGPEAVGTMLGRLQQPVIVSDTPTVESGRSQGVIYGDLASRLVTVGEPTVGGIQLPAAEESSVPSARPRTGDEPAVATHTSGTTGVPKLVLHSVRSITAQAKPQVLVARLLPKTEPIVVCVSWVHARSVSGLIALAASGLPLLALTDTDPESVAGHLAQHRPSFVETHPNIFVRWESLAAHPQRPFRTVRMFFSTFDAVHPRTVRTLLSASDRKPAVYVECYAQSEVGPATIDVRTRRRGAASHRRSVGWPLPGFTRVRIVDPVTKRPTKRGEPGLIVVQAKGRALSYLGEEERAPINEFGQWWNMGDLGVRSRSGRIRFLDREVDVVPGVPSSVEIEDILMERLEVLSEVVVVFVDGRLPTPVVCTHHDAPLDLERWKRETTDLPDMHEPVHLTWDVLPHTGTWKVRRPELRRLLTDGALRSGVTGTLVGRAAPGAAPLRTGQESSRGPAVDPLVADR